MEAVRKGVFSSEYVLHHAGEVVGLLRCSRWREQAQLTLEERALSLYREGVFRGRFVLAHEEQVVAAAEKPSALRNRFVLTLGGERVEMRPQGLLARVFTLRAGDAAVGEVVRDGWFGRRVSVQMPDAWPLAVQAFALWLALVVWRRMEEGG